LRRHEIGGHRARTRREFLGQGFERGFRFIPQRLVGAELLQRRDRAAFEVGAVQRQFGSHASTLPNLLVDFDFGFQYAGTNYERSSASPRLFMGYLAGL
jgi:hypothetical protein